MPPGAAQPGSGYAHAGMQSVRGHYPPGQVHVIQQGANASISLVWPQPAVGPRPCRARAPARRVDAVGARRRRPRPGWSCRPPPPPRCLPGELLGQAAAHLPIQYLDIQALQRAAQRGLGRRLVARLPRALGYPERGQLRLGQPRGELPDLGAAPGARQRRGHRDPQQHRQRVAPPVRAPDRSRPATAPPAAGRVGRPGSAAASRPAPRGARRRRSGATSPVRSAGSPGRRASWRTGGMFRTPVRAVAAVGWWPWRRGSRGPRSPPR